MSQIEDDMNYDMVKKFSYNKKNSKTDSESNLTLLDNFPTEKKSQFYEAYLEKILRVKPMTAKQKADVVKDMKKARSRFVFLKKEQTFFPRVTPRVSSRLSYKYQCYYALELVRRWLAYQGEEPTEILLEWYYMPLAQAIMMNEKEVYVLQNIFRFFEKCRTTLSIAPWDYRKQI